MNDEYYIKRCLELAISGLGHTAPNPLVGSVIVHNDTIIGEGYHKVLGGPHAEVNAINSVKDKELLTTSTLYVNLEPCSHNGKTPPCADLIIEKRIPKVVIGTVDTYHEVSGKGIGKLKAAGIEVIVGILEKECKELNKRFFTFQSSGKPYVILKWAQTNDGYIASLEQERGYSLKITNSKTNILVHQWRAEEQAILVGKQTILKDDPSLNVRLVVGKDPIPMIAASKEHIPPDYKIHLSHPVFFHDPLELINDIYKYCAEHKIQSILVEGGAQLLNYLIHKNIWNEARIITNKSMVIGNGIAAPMLNYPIKESYMIEDDQIDIIYNPIING